MMKRIFIFGSFLSMPLWATPTNPWDGFYIGATAGYRHEINNNIRNNGLSVFTNSAFAPNSTAMETSLRRLTSFYQAQPANSFTGGGQFGYNSQFIDDWIIGLDADITRLSNNASSFTLNQSINTVGLGTQTIEIQTTKKLSYLGLLKARLGILFKPTCLIYAAGAFAYGGASLNTSYQITNSVPTTFPGFNTQSGINKTIAGWAGGGGLEWSYNPSWSLKGEYLYYSLGPIRASAELTQNIATSPPSVYAQTLAISHTRFSESVFRLGVNYHV